MKASWQFSTIHNCVCKVIEEQSLWGQTVCRVWLPEQNTVVRVSQTALRPLDTGIQPEIEAHRISYIAAAANARGLGDGDISEALDAVFYPGTTKVIGLVVDKVDKIMHGMQLGAAGMHNQIKQWCSSGFLKALINFLLDHNYAVWLTSDHGNIECRGMGRPSEGVIAETRGERVRVYPTLELREKYAAQFSFAHKWQTVGLPENYFPLVASGNDAFIAVGESIVGHGGIALEEVIVPLVKFERRAQ